MTTDTAARRPTRHRSTLLLAAVGCLGIGAMLGGLAAEQPATRPAAQPTRAQVTGLAVDSRNNFLYRTFADGRVERLVLGQGVTANGTTAQWQRFKAN
jgi:hypothetical protein